MVNSSFELLVSVSGRPVREYGLNGKTWVEGRPGSKFTLRFRNSTATRILAVPSIDGISVIDGTPATADSRGWIVDGYRSVEIKGWRTSLEESAAFVFEKKDGSYAKITTGGGGNEGVIGVKVIAEKFKPPVFLKSIHHHHHHHYDPPPYTPPPYYPPSVPGKWGGSPYTYSTTDEYSCGLKDGVPNCFYANEISDTAAYGGVKRTLTSSVNNLSGLTLNPETKLGTAFGQAQADRVSEVDFERGLELATLEIFYSDETSLRTAGILVERDVPPVSKPTAPLPVAFGGSFCKVPGR